MGLFQEHDASDLHNSIEYRGRPEDPAPGHELRHVAAHDRRKRWREERHK